jgi:hypothetical protein
MKELNSISLRRHGFGVTYDETIKVGADCFIGQCGSGISVFGENGKVTKITSKYIYCTSESGSVVKYSVEKQNTIGKWRKNFYFINLNRTRDYNNENVCKMRPSVWNDKKLELEYK